MTIKTSAPNKEGIYYVTVPIPEALSPREQEAVEGGGPYPVRESEHLRQHEDLLDYLIERSVESWTRSQG